VKTSVVIPTYRRPRFVAWAVKSVLDQTRQPDEVIVVDNAPTDETATVVAGLGVRYVVEPRRGVSAARNRGAEEATGTIVAFLDDDSVASEDWLERLVDAYASSAGAVAVGGRIALRWPTAKPPWLDGLDGYYGTFDLGPRRALRYPEYPYASNMAIRRDALLAVGGFPVELGRRGASLVSNEEDGLFRRLTERGWSTLYEPDAVVYHWVHRERLSRRWLLRRAFAQGRSDVLVDVMFAARRRADRARRAVADVAEAITELRWAVTPPDGGTRLLALTRVNQLLGAAALEAALAVGPRARAEGT